MSDENRKDTFTEKARKLSAEERQALRKPTGLNGVPFPVQDVQGIKNILAVMNGDQPLADKLKNPMDGVEDGGAIYVTSELPIKEVIERLKESSATAQPVFIDAGALSGSGSLAQLLDDMKADITRNAPVTGTGVTAGQNNKTVSRNTPGPNSRK